MKQEVNEMSDSPLEKRINESAQSRKIYVQEELILDTAEKILDLLEKKKIKKNKLAGSLGKSGAYITQLLNGSRNMTLRTLSDVAFSLNARIHIEFRDACDADGWNFDAVQPIKMVTVRSLNSNLPANTSIAMISMHPKYTVAAK